MTTTQDEIDRGDAVKVEGLSKGEIDRYWVNYKIFNTWIPQLVLKRPTGSAAAVQVVAN